MSEVPEVHFDIINAQRLQLEEHIDPLLNDDNSGINLYVSAPRMVLDTLLYG